MGHDISARLKKGSERIAYLGIGAFDQPKSWILYESLNSNELNGGLSGNGGTKYFTSEELKIALQKFIYLTGEPQNQISDTIESTEQYELAKESIDLVMDIFGCKDEAKLILNLTEESKKSVEKFLREIQNDEGVYIDFY